MEIVRGLKSACLVDYTDFHLVVPFLPLVSHPPFVCLFLPSVHFLLLFRATFLLLDISFPRSTSKSYGHGTSSPGMFHSDFPKFSVRCQTIVDWIGLFTLSFFLFSLSLSLKEKVSVSFPEKFDGARFLSSSPFYRRITDWISSRRGIGLQRGPRGDGEFSGKGVEGK